MNKETILERRTYAEGQRIFREGEEGDRAYVVQSGMVEIFKTVDGVEVILGSVGKGGIFGEMALIDDKPRMAAARAAEGTTVIVVSRGAFKSKLDKADPFIKGLLNILVGNVRAASTKNVRDRVPAPAPPPAKSGG